MRSVFVSTPLERVLIVRRKPFVVNRATREFLNLFKVCGKSSMGFVLAANSINIKVNIALVFRQTVKADFLKFFPDLQFPQGGNWNGIHVSAERQNILPGM
jgi:hypothetical protein